MFVLFHFMLCLDRLHWTSPWRLNRDICLKCSWKCSLNCSWERKDSQLAVALATMEGPQKEIKDTPSATDKPGTEGQESSRTLLKDPGKERKQLVIRNSHRPSLLGFLTQEPESTNCSSIELAQKPNPCLEEATPWRKKPRDPEEYQWDRVDKYALYFQSNTILPISEVTNVTWGRKIEEIYFLCTLQGVFHSPVLFRDEE